ncbi:MAG TPA: methionine adenosyltransferase [Aquificales bacterium]|nr:methionine adenosyltransferase [Aquificales bacterium]
MANVVVSLMDFKPVYENPVEIVERKGTGHPDTICDNLAEELSVALCKLYLEEFGFVQHHNVDKALLVGGVADPKFKGGEIITPIEIYLVGRAIKEKDGKPLPVDELAIEVAKKWLRENIRNLDPEKHVIITPKIRPGSKDLVELFERFAKKGEVPLANDTSFAVGYAPFDDLEKVVYNTERYLNSAEFKKEHPYLGEDIKVMGVRLGDKIRITIAAAFVDKFVDNVDDYLAKKEIVKQKALENAAKYTDKEVEIFVNTADNPADGSVYITVTGTSAEAGDDGQVGRGNRPNGLITPYRPMTLEAAAGKNPVSHVGKIYSAVANIIANRVVNEIEEIEEAYCYMVSQIGKPITEPQACDVKVRTKRDIKGIEGLIKKIAEEEIAQIPDIWKGYVEKKFTVA